MTFKTIFTCPRCGRKSRYDGLVFADNTKSHEVRVAVYAGKLSYTATFETKPVRLCPLCAGKFGEVMTTVANKFLAKKEEKATKTTGAATARLQKLAANNKEEGKALLEEATAKVEAMNEADLKIAADVKPVQFFCKTCGTGVGGDKLKYGESVSIGLVISDPKDKLASRFFFSDYTSYGNDIRLLVNGNHRYLRRGGTNEGQTHKRLIAGEGRVAITTHCSVCKDNAEVVLRYSDGSTDEGPMLGKTFAQKLADKEAKLR